MSLSHDANIFSAYFIKESNKFLWQDMRTNTVHISDIHNNEISSFNPGFVAYGHVMTSDMKTYVASDKNWNLFEFHNGKKHILKKGFDDYRGYGKLLNLNLVRDKVLTSGSCGYKGESLPISDGLAASDKYSNITPKMDYSFMNCITLYSLIAKKAIKKLTGPGGKTISSISPNLKYILAGDESGRTYQWSLSENKKIQLDDPTNPVWLEGCYRNKRCIKEIKHMLATKKVIPKDFYDHPLSNGGINVAIKFIDEQGHFIRFINAVNYGVLYNVKSPEVVAYLNLDKNPQPDTFSVFYSANTIDTAPKAKILVMGQVPFVSTPKDKGVGIVVYEYNSKGMKLIRLWSPDGPPPHINTI